MDNNTALAAEAIWRAIELNANFIDEKSRKHMAKEIIKQFGNMGKAINTGIAVNLCEASKYIDDKEAIHLLITALDNDNCKYTLEKCNELYNWLRKLPNRLGDK